MSVERIYVGDDEAYFPELGQWVLPGHKVKLPKAPDESDSRWSDGPPKPRKTTTTTTTTKPRRAKESAAPPQPSADPPSENPSPDASDASDDNAKTEEND